jgi:hypothetical protein
MNVVAVLVGLSVGTYGLKAAAPLLLAGRALPGPLARLAHLLPAALLAALAAVSTFVDDGALVVDARAIGLAAALAALMLRAPFLLVVLVAAAATAGARMV